MLDDHVLTSSNKEQYSTRKVKSPYRDSETPKHLPFGYGQENNGRDEKYNQIKLQYDKSLKHSYIQIEERSDYPQFQRRPNQAPEFGGRFDEANRTPVGRENDQKPIERQVRPQSQFEGRRTSDLGELQFEGRQEQRQNLERTFGMRDKLQADHSQRILDRRPEQRQFEGRPDIERPAYGDNPYKPMMREERRVPLENESRPVHNQQPSYERREIRPNDQIRAGLEPRGIDRRQEFERTLQGRQGPDDDRFERTSGRIEMDGGKQPFERRIDFEARPNISRPDMERPVGFEMRGPYDRKPLDDRALGRPAFDQRPRMDERFERTVLERPGLERTGFERQERPVERAVERPGLERQPIDRPQYERSMPERQGLERVGLDRVVKRPEDRFEGRFEDRRMEERRLFDEKQSNERRPEFQQRPEFQPSRPEYGRQIPDQIQPRIEYRQTDIRPDERIQRRPFEGRPQSEARFDGRDLRAEQREPIGRIGVDPRYQERLPIEGDRRQIPERPRQEIRPDVRTDIHAQRLEQELARRGGIPPQRTDFGRQETISYLGRSDIRNRPNIDQESKTSLGQRNDIRPRTDLDRRMGELEQRQGLLKSSYDRIANREPIREPINREQIKQERSSQYEFAQRPGIDLHYQKFEANQKTTFQRPPLQDRPGFERFNRSYIGFDGKERSVMDRLGLDRSREMENHRFPTEHIQRPQLDLKQFGQSNYRESFENKGYQRTAYIPESRTPTYPRSDYRRDPAGNSRLAVDTKKH